MTVLCVRAKSESCNKKSLSNKNKSKNSGNTLDNWSTLALADVLARIGSAEITDMPREMPVFARFLFAAGAKESKYENNIP